MKKILFSSCIFITTLTHAQAPNFQWAENIGGGQETRGKVIKLDSQGNIYTGGAFKGTTDFDPGAGTYTITSSGDYDVFVTKCDQSGNLIWAKTWGGTGDDQLYALSVDASGNVFSTGYFYNTVDFDPGITTYTAASAGNKDIYITKLNTSGNFIWAKTMGEPGFDQAVAIKNDGAGNVFISGIFQGTIDFDPGASVSNLISSGYADGFISKLDAAGNLIWAKNIGGATLSDYVSCNSISLDATGNVCATGLLQGTADFDSNAGTYTLTAAGNSDIFVSKIDAAGNFLWAKVMGSSGTDQGSAIVVDATDNIYVSGIFQGTVDFDASVTTYTLTSAGGYDGFIMKTDATGNFIWSKSIGGPSYDAISNMALNTSGDIYAIGIFTGTSDFDPGVGTYTLTSNGIEDILLLQLDVNGNFVSGVSIGGTTTDNGQSVTTDIAGNIFLTGYFSNTVDFDPGAGIYNMTGTLGNFHCFILKLNSSISTDIDGTENSNLKFAKIYPNPSKSIFNVSAISAITQITIYNLQGIIVYTQHTNESILSIDLSDKIKGVYFYQIRNENGNINSGKIILE